MDFTLRASFEVTSSVDMIDFKMNKEEKLKDESNTVAFSLARDKKWGKLSLLLISRGAPVKKVRYHSLKFDCMCFITPSFLVSLRYGAVRCYLPHLFLSLASKILKYTQYPFS